jgi:hypothetical protein
MSNMSNDDRKPAERYRGQERRSGKDRREAGDRREEIRFELDKGDRRTGRDRRKQTGWDRIR